MVFFSHNKTTPKWAPWSRFQFQTANGLDEICILFAVLPAGLLNAQLDHIGIDPHGKHMGACNGHLWIPNLSSIFIRAAGFSISDLIRMKFFRNLISS